MATNPKVEALHAVSGVPTLAKLREPFAPHHISKLPKPTKQQTDAVRSDFKKGIRCELCGSWHHPDVIHLDYVGHAALTDRLLDTDPEWSWEPLSLDERGLPAIDANGGLWIKLTVLGVTRLGYGHAGEKRGGDAIKEIIGDALRNAAMRFGAALDLWHKGDLHSDDGTDQGQSQRGAVGPDGPTVPDAEYAKIVQLVEATRTNVPTMFQALRINAPNLRSLTPDEYAKAVNALNDKLAKMAKAETDAKGKTDA